MKDSLPLHHMQLPREVLVGEGVLEMVGEACQRLMLDRHALVITGPKSRKIAGDRVVECLRGEKVRVDIAIADDSTDDTRKRLQRRAASLRPSCLVGVGGGKDIDVAKVVSSKIGVPFISVPTAASHDGIASPYASLRRSRRPFSVRSQAPLAIIADIDVIRNSPYRLLAGGCGDIVAKRTAVKDWSLAHRIKGEYYGAYAANLAMMSVKLVTKEPSSIKSRTIEGIRTLVEALISCGVAMSIAGSSRPCSGSEHLFSHAVENMVESDSLHGERCGIGTIMCSYLHGDNWSFVKEFLIGVGAPTTAKEIGLSPQVIARALSSAHKIRPSRYTILGDTGLSLEAAESVVKATGVG